jgi:hypothetical protein
VVKKKICPPKSASFATDLLIGVKWESCWDEVTTCSQSCNFQTQGVNQETNRKQRSVTIMMVMIMMMKAIATVM